MTILTSLYELSQSEECMKGRFNVKERVLELKKTAGEVILKKNTCQHELKKVALFDNCTKRRIHAIERLEDKSSLYVIASKDVDNYIKEAAQKRLELL